MIPGIYKDEMHASDDSSNKIIVTEREKEINHKLKIYLKKCLKKKELPKLVFMLEKFVFPLFDKETNSKILSRLYDYTEDDIEFISKNVSQRLSILLEPVRQHMEVI